MNETSLSQTIDKLAQKKAEDLLTNMRSAISSALQPYCRHKDAGDEFHPEDIKNVLKEFTESFGKSAKQYTVNPTDGLVNSCRSQILNTLLKGLPRIAELAAMAAENDIDPEGQSR